MTAAKTTTKPAKVAEMSAWEPMRNRTFRILWIATLASNIGTWMHDVGASWLMTSLAPTPMMVALIQTATALPIFLLALPAGALSDIIDRRRLLIAVQIWLCAVAAVLAFLTLSGLTTAWALVGLTFAMGIGSAMMLPAWAAIAPELVTRSQLQSAIALNSLGINIARAIGPALAGVVVSLAGPWAVFALNALSYVGIIYVLARWQRHVPVSQLPTERFFGAIRSGFRFVRYAPDLQAAIIRGVGFFIFASALWALLPLIAKNLANGGPQAFGLLVASIGVGAVVGAVVLPKVRAKFSRDVLVAGASLLYAAAMLALSTLDSLVPLCLAMAAAGIAWITVLSTLQVAAQLALPNWVRSRGIAVFMMVFMGAMALGSLGWGKVAELTSINQALLYAAAGAVVGVVLTWHWRVGGKDDIDLSPSMHWPEPVVHDGVTRDRGPVLVTIEYNVDESRVGEFVTAIRELGEHRRRDGAFSWSVSEDTETPHRFIEVFSVESWLEHLRQHERTSDADRVLQTGIQETLIDGTKAKVTHYIAPRLTRKENASP